MKKFISALLSIMIMSSIFVTSVFADKNYVATVTDSGTGTSSSKGTGWGTITPTGGDMGGMGSAVGTILGFVQFIGYAIAIGMLIYIGIKYATASANEKADLKGASVKYVIGAILIAGATTVAGWFFSIGTGLG